MISRSSRATIPVARRSSSSSVKELSHKKSVGGVSNRQEQLNVPDDSWEANRLGEFARAEQKQLRLYDKKMAIHAFRLGHALSLAHEKVPYGDWGKFLKKFKVSEATDWRARKLYEVAKSENALKSLGIADAYKKFGINKGRKQKPKSVEAEKPLPPKEPKSVLQSLSQLVVWLERLFDEVVFTDWNKESKPQCLGLIEDACSILNRISGEVGHD